MPLSLSVEVKELPAYRVAAVSGQALTFEAGIQPLSVTEQAEPIGEKLLSWAKAVGLGRERIAGLFGLSIIDGGWVAVGEFNARAEKTASQQFIQGLPIGQDVLAVGDIAAILGAEGLAAGMGMAIRHTRPGLYGVARVKGPYSKLSSVAEELMTEWLPSSGLAYENEPLLNLYLNNPDTTPPDALLTDFCVPIAGFRQLPLGLLGAFHR